MQYEGLVFFTPFASGFSTAQQPAEHSKRKVIDPLVPSLPKPITRQSRTVACLEFHHLLFVTLLLERWDGCPDWACVQPVRKGRWELGHGEDQGAR